MLDAATVIARLRADRALSDALVDAVASRLSDGRVRPDQALLEAGVPPAKIARLLDPALNATQHDSREPPEPRRAPEPSIQDLVSLLVDITPRFQIQGELARGAMGVIHAGWDMHLGRPVAIKQLINAEARELDQMRFLEEAQVTGQLQHPSIVPVYELGRYKGQVSFVMRRIDGRSLKDIIALLRAKEPEATRQYGFGRLLDIFRKLCDAVAFAHTRGVVHRDLKPSNVMVGDFGQVVLLDWGLCKIIGRTTRSTRSTSERWQTVHGALIGTPAYMAPEQAMGLTDQVDPRTDVYGLGAILYHLLTLRPPFTGKTNKEIIGRVLRETAIPPSQRAPDRAIPRPIEAVCLRCLARDPDERFEDAGALVAALDELREAGQTTLPPLPIREPSREVTLSSDEIDRLVAQGLDALERHQGLLEDTALIRDNFGTARMETGAASRGRAAEAETRLAQLHLQTELAFADVVLYLGRAVLLDPSRAQAKAALLDLLTSRGERAQSRGDEGQAQLYQRLSDWLEPSRAEARTVVSIETQPPGVSLMLGRYEHVGHRLAVPSWRDLGTSPVSVERLEPGVYRLEARGAGLAPLRTSVVVERGRTSRHRFRLFPQGAMPDGFVHIPGGTFRVGGPADLSLPGGEQALPDYFISVLPVTAARYLDFIQDLAVTEPDEAARRVPRAHDGFHAAWSPDPRGVYRLPSADGPFAWRADMPVVGIGADDAEAYCRWLSELEGVRFRLPTDEEWEKAARGPEGRRFPWGDRFDAGFAATPEVWAGSLPPPVGHVREDESPFGVRDMAGGVREWTSTRYTGGRVAVRGGSFLVGDERGRPLWHRERLAASATAPDLGFRLVRDPQ